MRILNSGFPAVRFHRIRDTLARVAPLRRGKDISRIANGIHRSVLNVTHARTIIEKTDTELRSTFRVRLDVIVVELFFDASSGTLEAETAEKLFHSGVRYNRIH